jgi:hypothetical protein
MAIETHDSHIVGERRFCQCQEEMEKVLSLAPGEEQGKVRAEEGWEEVVDVCVGADLDKEGTAYALSVEQHCRTELESRVTLSTVLSAAPLWPGLDKDVLISAWRRYRYTSLHRREKSADWGNPNVISNLQFEKRVKTGSWVDWNNCHFNIIGGKKAMSVAKILKGHELFANLGVEDVDKISGFPEKKICRKNTIIFNYGEKAKG